MEAVVGKVPKENPVEAVVLLAVAVVNEAKAGAVDEEAMDPKAGREEVVALVVLDLDDDCKLKANPLARGFAAAGAVAFPKPTVWGACPKDIVDPVEVVEFPETVPKIEGFEVTFPKEKPESPWVCVVDAALVVDG